MVDLIKTESLQQKEILTFEEFCSYTGFSKSHAYKLTHQNKIPYYKPGGKVVFFQLEEVKNWLLSNRVSTNKEIESRASAYLLNKKSKK